MDKIRILHCIETISSGGVERVRLNYARSMDKDRFELKIVCTQAQGEILSELERLDIQVIPLGTFSHPFEFGVYRKLLRVIKSFQPHIIHGAVFEGNSMAFVGKVFGRVPIAILEETSEPKFRSNSANILLHLYGRFTDIFIGISPAVISYLQKVVHVRETKLRLLPNGVEIPENIEILNKGKLREELGFSDEDIVIGSVGRVYDSVKRFSDILKALKFLAEPRLKFLLIGQGPDLKMLKELAYSLDLQSQVCFLGYQPEPNLFYGRMDLFCVPSLQEGFGLVAVEAMMHQLPVIATRVGGLKSIVVEGETGLLVSPNNPRQLAEKIWILLQNPETRKSMGKRGKQRALENYTVERYQQNLESLYLFLLKSKKINQ